MATTSTCKNCKQHFSIDQEDLDFLNRISPVINGNKFLIPPPTLCPECRLQRRLAFRNPIHVTWDKSALSGTPTLSAFVGDHPFSVITNAEWWGDSWDPLSYGRTFDFQESFFSQFQKLREAAPFAALLATNVENSQFCSNVSHIKNCYLVFNTKTAEDCMYCDYIWGSKDCLECTRTIDSELCYDSVECHRCYNVQSSEFSDDCKDSFFLSHCRSCTDCFGCVNLYRKKFHLFNKPCTKEEYHAFLQSIDLSLFSTRSHYASLLSQLTETAPHPHFHGQRVENVTGNYISDSRHISNSFFIKGAEDCKFCFIVNGGVKDCYDYSHFGGNATELYECQSCGNDVNNLLFCRDCWNGNSNLIYCASCFGCHDCFGCVGLRNKHYCIFNKQYEKKEYYALLAQIISQMISQEEWGEFFPISSAPFPYNLSFANRYFPLSKEQIIRSGLRWHEKEGSTVEGAILGTELPDGLPTTDEALTVRCISSHRAFKITSNEIHLYRRFCAPLPRKAYDERMEDRWRKLGGIKLHSRLCPETKQRLSTTHPPNTSYPVWERAHFEKMIFHT